MLALWLATGLIAKVQAANDIVLPRGGYHETDGRGRKRREDDERKEREELRRIVARAFGHVEDGEEGPALDEAEALVAAVGGPSVSVPDLSNVILTLASVREAAEAYQRALEDEEDDEMFMILMAA